MKEFRKAHYIRNHCAVNEVQGDEHGPVSYTIVGETLTDVTKEVEAIHVSYPANLFATNVIYNNSNTAIVVRDGIRR